MTSMNRFESRGPRVRALTLSSYEPRRIALMLAVLAVALFWFIAQAHARGPVSVADLAERLQDAVVNISTTQTVKGKRHVPIPKVPKGSPFEEFFDEFFKRQQRNGKPRKVNSLGSGFVIDSKGIIVTNNHVIADADEITVNFPDGTKLPVKEILGRDKKTDIAILRVEPKKPLTSVSLGNSNKMRVGDWVMAIGNPFGLGGTVTVGIISARNRDINSGPYDDFIQTDAAINRGNSGGPLFNMDGEVIGINTAIISPSGGSIGIGFAIPSSIAKPVVEQLTKFGETRRGWLGVRIQSVTEEIAESLGMMKARGALVANVTPKSPAERAGLKSGDVIVEFDGKDVERMKDLPRIVADTPIDKSVDVLVLRRGKSRKVQVKIGRLEEGEKLIKAQEDKKKKQSVKKTKVLGLTLAPLSDEVREKYSIGKDIDGLIITEVDPASAAAEKGIRPGQILVEVAQKRVKNMPDVSARVAEWEKEGNKSVLLLISSPKGDLRFVAVKLKG